MKCLSLFLILPLAFQLTGALAVPKAALAARQQEDQFKGGFGGGQGQGGFGGFGGFGGKGGQQGQGQGQGGNQGGGKKGGGGQNAASSSAAAPPAASSPANNNNAAGGGAAGNNGQGNNGQGGNGQGGNGQGNNGNPQTSLTLDPSVIAPAFADGKAVAATEVDSLQSTNNFINFCVGKTITNGQQVKTGSCNPAPMGDLPSTANIPSAKFSFPANMGTVQANTDFTVKLNIQKMQTGAFTNAAASFFSAPQQLNGQGQIIGHSHIVIEPLESLTATTPLDPSKFAFFLGLNAAAQGGVLSGTVPGGLPAGIYKLSSINTAANHQPVSVPVAQHGSLDDAIYFTVTDGGAAGGNGQGANGQGQGANGQGQGANGQGANGQGQGANGQGANGQGQGANGQGANGQGQGANGQGQGANGQGGRNGKGGKRRFLADW